MAYFTKEFVQYLKDLAANNNRDWFHANKKRYENEVKKPFEAFVDDLIKEMKKEMKEMKDVDMSAKDAIFRIHRDIRFSKDKTPYKTHMSAAISPGGKKDYTTPGLYVELGPEHVRVYGGVYGADKDQLYSIRNYISNNMSGFSKAISDKKFKDMYGEIRGEKNKIIPKEFRQAAEDQSLLFNKQFYYFGQMDPKETESDDLLNKVMSYFKASKPVREFLTKALND